MAETKALRRSPRDEESRERLLSLREAANYLAVSYWTVRGMVANDTLPCVQLPVRNKGSERALRRILIDRQDLDLLIERNKDKGQPT